MIQNCVLKNWFANRFSVMAIAMLAFVAVACSSDEPEQAATPQEPETPETPVTPDDPEIPSQPVIYSDAEAKEAKRAIAFDLLNIMAQDNTTDNLLLAPYSLSNVLSIAANAADEATWQEITKQLMATDLDQLNKINKEVADQLANADPQVVFKSANAVWIPLGLNYLDNFANAVQNFYGARTFNADLSTPAGQEMINNWCNEATNGLIPTMPGNTSASEVLIANANYFKADWTKPFYHTPDIDVMTFKSTKGNQTVDQLVRIEKLESMHAADGTYAVRLPYSTGAFRMTLLLPAEGKNAADMAKNLTIDAWDNLNSQFNGKTFTYLAIPRFEASYEADLRQSLSKFMPITVNGNYPNMCDIVLTRVNSVSQGVKIAVNEMGTEAAAVTDLAMSSGEPDYAVFDRPFMFVIDEASTKSILFIGVINSVK